MIKAYALLLFAALPFSALAQTATPTPNPHPVFINPNTGLPCVGCLLYTYQAGTTTPLATYPSSSEGSSNTNPIVLGTDGGASIWLGSSSYKFALYDSNNNLLWTQDNISSISSLLGQYLPLAGGTLTGGLTGTTGTFSGTLQAGTLQANTALSAPNINYPSFGYTAWVSGGTISIRNNATMQIANTGTDATVVFGDWIAAQQTAGLCGHMYVEPGDYPVKSFVQETYVGYSTQYYAIRFPQQTATSFCQWFVTGDQGAWNNSYTGNGTAIFDVQQSALNALPSGSTATAFWTQPGTSSTMDVDLENFVVRFPNNQNTSQAEVSVDMSNALSSHIYGVNAGFATFPNNNFPVSGSVGFRTTTSSHNFNDIQFSSAQGYYTAFDVQSEFTYLNHTFASRTHDCYKYGFNASAGLIYHASSWGMVTCQFYTNGLTLGPNYDQGAGLNIAELDFGDVPASPWIPVYHAKETNPGYGYGTINFTVVGTSAPVVISNIFDGGGGLNFCAIGYGENNCAGYAQVKNLVPDSDLKWQNSGAPAYWTLGANMSWVNKGGVGSSNAISMSTSGSGSSAYTKSLPFNLVCGQTYTMTGNIDASHVTGSTGPAWDVYDSTVTTVYGGFSQFPGSSGFVSNTFTFSPSGCSAGSLSQVVMIAANRGATLTGAVVWSMPMIVAGSLPRPYLPNSFDDDTGTILSGALPAPVTGTATLSAGTVTVSNAAACAVGSTCKYTLTHCGPNSSTAIGNLSTGTIVAGTSFVINALTATNTVATGDLSTICWRIN